MNKRAKFQLMTGLILTLLLCGGLFLYRDSRNTHPQSASATLKANTKTIGTDYAGQITREFVHKGDHVKTGDTLYYIKSPTLIQAINSGLITTKDLPFRLTDTNEMIITATSNGYITAAPYTLGSYVRAASELATITNDETATVTANFTMSKPQYSKLTSSTPLKIALPDGRNIDGDITDITLGSQTKPYLVTIVATTTQTGPQIADSSAQGLPVDTSLQLSSKHYWKNLTEWVRIQFARYNS